MLAENRLNNIAVKKLCASLSLLSIPEKKVSQIKSTLFQLDVIGLHMVSGI